MPMSKYFSVLLACLLAVMAAPVGAEDFTTDPVLFWNRAALDAVRFDQTVPPMASRSLAIVHAAIFDAVNSLDHRYAPYKVNLTADQDTSREAAVVAAGFTTLSSLFPLQNFDALKAQSLALIPDGSAKTKGLALGETVAQQILNWRAGDGWNATVAYTPTPGVGNWRPTLPTYANFLLPQWGQVTPFTMTSGTQFRQGPPPALDSAAYAAAYNEVKVVGAQNSVMRTAEQTEIARFWADGPGTQTPPGHWNTIATSVALTQQTDMAENARLFALLNLALADAAIAAWDMKLAYDFWRPLTGIQEGEADGNPLTGGDPSWLPLINTPAFPAYVSGHSTFSGAAAALLAEFFGTDAVSFTTDCDALPGVTRSFDGFWEAAEEAGMSRIYGGIHWQFDNMVGLEAGKALGEYVAANFLVPVPLPGTFSLMGTLLLGLLVYRGRRR